MPEKPSNDKKPAGEKAKNEPPSSEPDSGGAEPDNAAAKTGAEDTNFKYGDGAPEELQGKTAQEAAEQYEKLKTAVRQYFAGSGAGGSPQPASPSPHSPYQGYQQPSVHTPNHENDMSNPNEGSDPELWFRDPGKAEKNLEARFHQMMQQYAQQATAPLAQSSAEAAKHLSRTDPTNKDVWDKFGEEVEMLVSNVHPTYKANKALWDQAAKIVKGNHIDELVQEKASELAASGVGVEGGSSGGELGSGGGGGRLAELRETDYGRELIEKFGEAGVLRNMEKMGESVESFTAKAKNTHIVRDPDKPGEWKNFSIGQGAVTGG